MRKTHIVPEKNELYPSDGQNFGKILVSGIMKQYVSYFLCFCVACVLTSCNAPFSPNPDSTHQAIQHQYQTISAFLTATALATTTSAPVAEVLPSVRTVVADIPQTNPPPQPQPTLAITSIRTAPAPAIQQASSTPVIRVKPQSADRVTIPCEAAQPGRILDVSVPDDTQLKPGEYFSKTWRLVNAGSCPWTRDYAVVWFSGDDLGIVHAQHLETQVIPGQAVDITIDMVAPQNPGAYQSNWKLRNPQGALFGIGPAGASPFWARIVVIPVETPTAAVSYPTPTTTPVVIIGGTFSLTLDTMLDLDTGQSTAGSREDLALQQQLEGQLFIAAVNEARLVPFTGSAPDHAACLSALADGASPAPDPAQPGASYCYRTSEGLPGWVTITTVIPENKQADVQFITWAAP